jgi:hypothetical protein
MAVDRDNAMRLTIVLVAFFALIASAEAYTSRDRIERRFDQDIRSGNEAMRSRFGDRSNRIDQENTRLRERLNTSKGTGRLNPR